MTCSMSEEWSNTRCWWPARAPRPQSCNCWRWTWSSSWVRQCRNTPTEINRRIKTQNQILPSGIKTYPFLNLVKRHHGRGVILVVVVLHCLPDAGLDEVLYWSPLQWRKHFIFMLIAQAHVTWDSHGNRSWFLHQFPQRKWWEGMRKRFPASTRTASRRRSSPGSPWWWPGPPRPAGRRCPGSSQSSGQHWSADTSCWNKEHVTEIKQVTYPSVTKWKNAESFIWTVSDDMDC